MPRGRKKTHKGGHRHFTSEDDLAAQAEKERKQREWRVMKGIESDEEEEAGGAEPGKEGGAKAAAEAADDDKSSSEEEEGSGEDNKPKGIAHLIEIENPNHVVAKTKKVSDLAKEGPEGAVVTMSRREREELEKQQAKERYEKLHVAGKTDEARADLARLALIRKQREDAAKKRDEEKKLQEQQKTAAEQKLLEKKKAVSGGDSKH